jgi:PPOX class probable F420-dependent enzyme
MAYTVIRRLSDLPFKVIGPQPAFSPDDLEKFVREARIAVLSYARKDGRPCQVPIWYEYRAGTFYMSTLDNAAKAHALRRNPRVCLTIQDERPPYRAVVIDADVELKPHEPGDPTSVLATRYFGRVAGKIYQKMAAAESTKTGSKELTIVAHPTEVRGFDNTRAIDKATLAFVRLRHRLPIPTNWL